jgi:hypothetical protein
MIGAGLIDVEFTVTARSWRGGEAGTLLPHAVSVQLHDDLVDTGLVTGRELEEMWEGLLSTLHPLAPDDVVGLEGWPQVVDPDGPLDRPAASPYCDFVKTAGFSIEHPAST